MPRRAAEAPATTRFVSRAPSPRMRAKSILLAAAAAALALAGCVVPKEAAEESVRAEEHTIAIPDELAWQDGPPSLPAGARFVALSGDPTQQGPFTMRVELPADYRIPPHTHPGTEHVTVVSGTGFLGTGDAIDEANATRLPTGAFFVMPPGMEHYFLTGDEAVVLQLHGDGPWGIEYLDPADDPRAR